MAFQRKSGRGIKHDLRRTGEMPASSMFPVLLTTELRQADGHRGWDCTGRHWLPTALCKGKDTRNGIKSSPDRITDRHSHHVSGTFSREVHWNTNSPDGPIPSDKLSNTQDSWVTQG